jgi:Formate/nitrite transporter
MTSSALVAAPGARTCSAAGSTATRAITTQPPTTSRVWRLYRTADYGAILHPKSKLTASSPARPRQDANHNILRPFTEVCSVLAPCRSHLPSMPNDTQEGLTHAERQEVEERTAPRSPVIYEVVRQQGEEELDRPDASLFWSGIAAGLAIMASVATEGALRQKLPPEMPGREAVANLGYSIGFLIVILGRMQLFTEQTIVTVLPVMAEPGWRKLRGTARLWIIVFIANMTGACIVAFINVHLRLVSPDLLASAGSGKIGIGDA